jgi:hypothetical protein
VERRRLPRGKALKHPDTASSIIRSSGQSVADAARLYFSRVHLPHTH